MTIRRLVLSLVIGGIFGLTLSTKYPDLIAALGSLAAAALIYGAWHYNDRSERPEALGRAHSCARETTRKLTARPFDRRAHGRAGLDMTMIGSNTLVSDPTSIVIRQRDADLLHPLAVSNLLSNSRAAGTLLDELRRAEIRSDDHVPDDVVGLESWVTFVQRNQPSGNPQRVQLVTPAEADPKEGRISVLSTLGAGLIGLKAGQSIDWPDRRGARQLLAVLEVSWLQEPAARADPHADMHARSPEQMQLTRGVPIMTTCDGENGHPSPLKPDRKCPATPKGATEESASNVVPLPLRNKKIQQPREDDWPPGAA